MFKKMKKLFVASLIFTIFIFTKSSIAQIVPEAKKNQNKPNSVNPTNKEAERTISKKFTITDSVLTHWFYKSLNSDEYNFSEYKNDTIGNFYCVAELKKDVSKRQLLKLRNGSFGSWEVFETGIEDKKYMSLEQDGQGNLYVKSDDGLYKLGENKWEKIFSWYKGVESSIPFPKSDGGLYARITDWNSPLQNTTIVKYENGTIKQLGKDGKPLLLMSSNDWFVVSRDGTIYSYDSHPSHIESKTKTTNVYRWVGNKWEITGIMPEKITYIDFDNNNNLYAAGSKGNSWFFKKWNGTEWLDVSLPDSLNKNIPYHPIFDEKKNVFVEGRIGINHLLYQLVDGKWVLRARDGMDINFRVNGFIPANGKVFAEGQPYDSKQNWDYIYSYAPRWVVSKREVENIQVESGVILTQTYSKNLSQFYLYDDNGKKGIQNLKGATIVRPVFDKIQVVETPINYLAIESNSKILRLYDSDFALEMIMGTDSIYVKIPYFDKNPDKLKCFVKRPNRTCGACKGSGTSGGKQITKEIKGDWVEGEVRQIKKLTINGYMLETTKIPGYYKESKTTTEIIPGHTCSNCRGEGVIWEFDSYYYNTGIRKYMRSWEQY
ncbi:MAG: hypothetical protein WBP16_16835 [Ferruginibacter sp.]